MRQRETAEAHENVSFFSFFLSMRDSDVRHPGVKREKWMNVNVLRSLALFVETSPLTSHRFKRLFTSEGFFILILFEQREGFWRMAVIFLIFVLCIDDVFVFT